MEDRYDIGKLRDNPSCLYDLCLLIWLCDESGVWDRDSECYKAFHAVVNSLSCALPPLITIDLRDPDAMPQPAPDD